MTDENPPFAAPETRGNAENTASTVKDQASQVSRQVADSATNVAGTAKEEIGKVAGESRKQAKALYDETRTQLTEQAGVQQQRVAAGLRDIGGELSKMADSSNEPGVASDVVSQVAARTTAAASWLDDRDPGSLLQEVRNFARRKPGTFIAVAAVAGLVAGRVVRSLASEAHDEKADAAPEFQAPQPSAGTGSFTSEPLSATPVYDATVDQGRLL